MDKVLVVGIFIFQMTVLFAIITGDTVNLATVAATLV
jgi:hypothetical protein